MHPGPQKVGPFPHHPCLEQQDLSGHEPKPCPHLPLLFLLMDVLLFAIKGPRAAVGLPIGGMVCDTVFGAAVVLFVARVVIRADSAEGLLLKTY
jgi:hypothetical protein